MRFLDKWTDNSLEIRGKVTINYVLGNQFNRKSYMRQGRFTLEYFLPVVQEVMPPFSSDLSLHIVAFQMHPLWGPLLPLPLHNHHNQVRSHFSKRQIKKHLLTYICVTCACLYLDCIHCLLHVYTVLIISALVKWKGKY